MSRPITMEPQASGSDIQTAARSIRETIAHFFGNDSQASIDTPVSEHTLRDIGVNRTMFDNM